jgi:predicted CopG family antitoxin
MKTLNVSISDSEFIKFGLKSDNLSFSDFMDIVGRELSKQRLKESLKLAEKFGLSEMTIDEITKEVKAVRKNAKNRN